MTWLSTPHRKTSANAIQCRNCGAMVSRYTNKCWKCGEET